MTVGEIIMLIIWLVTGLVIGGMLLVITSPIWLAIGAVFFGD